jgi:hypothetical protein
MRTFQIVFHGGLTRNIAADFYRRTKLGVKFYVDGKLVAAYPPEALVRIEEVDVADFAA